MSNKFEVILKDKSSESPVRFTSQVTVIAGHFISGMLHSTPDSRLLT